MVEDIRSQGLWIFEIWDHVLFEIGMQIFKKVALNIAPNKITSADDENKRPQAIGCKNSINRQAINKIILKSALAIMPTRKTNNPIPKGILNKLASSTGRRNGNKIPRPGRKNLKTLLTKPKCIEDPCFSRI